MFLYILIVDFIGLTNYFNKSNHGKFFYLYIKINSEYYKVLNYHFRYQINSLEI